jgi:hypothetical protein
MVPSLIFIWVYFLMVLDRAKHPKVVEEVPKGPYDYARIREMVVKISDRLDAVEGECAKLARGRGRA